MIDEIIREVIKQRVKENEKKIFEQKVADGTLVLVPEKEIQKLIKKQNKKCFSATQRQEIGFCEILENCKI